MGNVPPEITYVCILLYEKVTKLLTMRSPYIALGGFLLLRLIGMQLFCLLCFDVAKKVPVFTLHTDCSPDQRRGLLRVLFVFCDLHPLRIGVVGKGADKLVKRGCVWQEGRVHESVRRHEGCLIVSCVWFD